MKRTLCLALFFLTFASLFGQEPKYTLSGGALFGQTWLGSQDIRRGGIYSLSVERPEPRFHFLGHGATMLIEGYYMFTKGGAVYLAGPNSSHHYGIVAVARYYDRDDSPVKGFYEFGWGLQFANRLTHDLDSRVSSTPLFGAGFVVPNGKYDLVFNARYFHISNAGTAGGNEGLNFYQLSLGVRF